jgi:hypothetical protein
LAPSFAGLRQFPEGRGFKQWTGDDSKALMKVWIYNMSLNLSINFVKVYLPAIEGHVPAEMVQAIHVPFLNSAILLGVIFLTPKVLKNWKMH